MNQQSNIAIFNNNLNDVKFIMETHNVNVTQTMLFNIINSKSFEILQYLLVDCKIPIKNELKEFAISVFSRYVDNNEVNKLFNEDCILLLNLQ
jgi:hypothetical protein